MSYQRTLLRACSSRPAGPMGRWLARNRPWTVEQGEAAGLRLRFPQNTDYIWGTSELPVQRTIARQLKKGQTFYDIGGNVGFFSLLAARLVGETGHVYTFEPLAEHVATIQANARLNRMPQVTAVEAAVGRAPGEAELVLTEWDGGAALSTAEAAPQGATTTRRVRVIALDEFVASQGLRPPSMVKIDVEGAEKDVLEGMRSVIARHKPVLLYEVDDADAQAFQARWQELDRMVAALGYEVTRLQDSYPGITWNVGHSLAIPRAGQDLA
jgi:FkbM family methyltransferase